MGLPHKCRAHAPATAYGTAGTDTVFTETVTETVKETATETDTGMATLCWKPDVTTIAIFQQSILAPHATPVCIGLQIFLP